MPKISDEDREDLKDETYRKTGFWPEKKKEKMEWYTKEKTPEEMKKEKEWDEMMAKIPDDAKISIDPKRLG